MLVVVGDAMSDIVVRPSAPLVDGGDTPAEISVGHGGSGANLAVAAAAAGAEVHLLAAVGADAVGKSLEVGLTAAGVHPHLQRCARPTGTVVSVVHDGGERSLLSDRGANSELTGAALRGGYWRPGTHLHVSGYVLADHATRPVGLTALRRAAAAGMTRSVDPSPRPCRLPAADWCVVNLPEGRALTGRQEASEIAAALLGRFEVVAITLGPGGAIMAARGKANLHLTAIPADVTDTTGAGDAFSGTWIARLLAGDDPAQAVHAALAAASRVVAVRGAGWAQAASSPNLPEARGSPRPDEARDGHHRGQVGGQFRRLAAAGRVDVD